MRRATGTEREGRAGREARRARAWTLGLALGLLVACGGGGERNAGGEERAAADSADRVVADDPATRGTDVDRRIFAERMELARTERLDTLPIGKVIVRLGESFLGSKYTPGTLDPEGPEHLVINLREFDCVTYIENVLAMARIIRSGDTTWTAFVDELERIRYRGGELDGWASRLHYFSEWIDDNARLGLLRNVTRELGGIRMDEPIDFMSTHADAYRQLAVAENVESIRRIESRLSGEERWWIPESGLSAVMPRIQDGDIIAATSSIEGLDIAHTGIAVRHADGVYLMHAPLVGEDVQLSDQTLDVRVQRIEGQDGLMVARPL